MYVEENCSSDTLQGDEDMTHHDSLDLTIEFDAAVWVPVMPIAADSRNVDIELQVQAYMYAVTF